jgi:hypothetical protein
MNVTAVEQSVHDAKWIRNNDVRIHGNDRGVGTESEGAVPKLVSEIGVRTGSHNSYSAGDGA